MASHLPFPRWGSFPAREGEVRSCGAWRKQLLASLGLFVLAGSLASGQQMIVEEGKRKVKTRVSPNYPELARRMNIGGKVRIEVVIAPDGRVKSYRALGGHPVLVQPCMDAVKEWRFDASPEESTQVVEFNFKEQ
jgi:TonB family protein